MATDSTFVAISGGNVDVGIVGWGIPGGPALHPLDIGVFGLGAQRGVFGLIDDGTFTPELGLPTGANYIDSSAILGAAPKVTGVGGVSATSVGVFGQAGAFATSLSPGVSCGVLGTSRGQAGVMGFSDSGPGMLGQSTNNIGVVGQSGSFGPPLADPQHPKPKPDSHVGAGVFGTGLDAIGVGGTSATSIGVLGRTGAKAPAFDAKTTYTAGVVGTSKDTTGVIGFSESHTGVLGVLGAAPPSTADLPPNYVAGVIGSSDQQAGVIGMSNKLAGVQGISTIGAGVVGQSANPQSFGGFFFGNVHMTGMLTSDSVKGAVVPFPDGTKRLLICTESPEPWFEDFGAAKLKRGRAVIKIDADFARVIKLNDYHVFLTPKGDCRGLCVRRQGGASFEVRELAGGKSSIAFSYRIVGRRKDIRAHKRFAKIDVTPPMLPARRAGRTQSSVDALLAKVRKQAGAKPGRARRRKTARSPQPLPTLLAKLRKQAGAKPARRRKRAKKRA